MITSELLDYIKRHREQGFSDEEIKHAMRNAGWQEHLVDEAFMEQTAPEMKSGRLLQNDGLPGTAQLLKEALQQYKQQFLGLSALGLILFGAIFLFAASVLFLIPIFLKGYSSSTIYGLLAFWLLIFLCLQAYVQASLIYAAAHEKEAVFKRGLIFGAKHFFPFVTVILLTWLTIAGGAVLFIIPAYILALPITFAPYVLANENLKGIKAIQQARLYVKGYWWAAFWRLTIMGFLLALISSGLIAILEVFQNVMAVQIIFAIIFGLHMIAMSLLAIIYTQRLYVHLRRLAQNRVQPQLKISTKIYAILGAALIGTFLVSSLLVTVLDGPRSDARDQRRSVDQQYLQTALKIYYASNQQYPSSLNELVPDSAASIPLDPLDQHQYSYRADQNQQNYQLCVSFENQTETCLTANDR